MPDTLIDGASLFSRASTVGAPRFSYPFRNNGDIVSAFFEEDYWQTKATWTPCSYSTPHETFRDFYLVGESNPAEMISGLYVFSRTYSRVPSQQINPSTYLFTAPNLPAISVGALTTATTSAYSVPATAAARIGNYAFLSVVESGAGGNFSGYYGAEMAFTRSGSDFTLPANHGVIVGDIITARDDSLANTGRTYGTVSAVAGNVITVTLTSYATTASPVIGGFILAAIFTADLRLRKRTRSSCHQGEVLSLLARRIEDFYLPGVTTGISTYTDITPQDGFTISDFLGAYNLVSTWFNVQSDVLARWPNEGSPLLVQRYTQCRLSDV